MNMGVQLAVAYTLWALLVGAVIGDAMLRGMTGEQWVWLLVGLGVTSVGPLAVVHAPDEPGRR